MLHLTPFLSLPTSPLGPFLQRLALEQPGVMQGVACRGTALESITFGVKNKAFLFLRDTEARLKLRTSLAEAVEWSHNHPTWCRVGALGWVTLFLPQAEAFPRELVQKWVMESYHLLVYTKGKPPEIVLQKAPKVPPSTLPTKGNKQ